jgi:hypothetical protein
MSVDLLEKHLKNDRFTDSIILGVTRYALSTRPQDSNINIHTKVSTSVYLLSIILLSTTSFELIMIIDHTLRLADSLAGHESLTLSPSSTYVVEP